MYPADLAAIVVKEIYKAKSGAKLALSICTEVFEVCFFLSLRTEERQALSTRVIFIDPDDPDPRKPRLIRSDRWTTTRFESPVPFTVANLSKLSQAMDPWCCGLCVFGNNSSEIFIWGVVDQVLHHSTATVHEGGPVYEQPGIFTCLIEGVGRLAAFQRDHFIARLSHGSILSRELDAIFQGPVRAKLQPGINSLRRKLRRQFRRRELELEENSLEVFDERYLAVICRILIGIQRYGHGGALLISSPSIPNAYKTELSYKYKLRYDRLGRELITAAYNRVLEYAERDMLVNDYMERQKSTLPMGLYLDHEIHAGDALDSELAVTGAVKMVASFSRVDGLVHLSSSLELLGFGAEIRTEADVKIIRQARTAEGRGALSKVPAEHYGTRHRSMFRFCNKFPEAVGFVVSQDGDIRAVTRIGRSIVMWDNLMVHNFLENVRARWKATSL